MSTGRDHIIDAIITVIAAHGIDKATVRTVAGEAQVSIGAVQHHFPTKAAMLAAAMETIAAAVAADVDTAATTADPSGSSADPVADAASDPSGSSAGAAQQSAHVLHRLAFLLCAVSDDDVAAAAIWLDFVALSRVTPELADIHTRTWTQLRARMAQLIGTAHPAHPAPEAAAAWALATFDGIAVARVSEPRFMTGRQAANLAERTLAAIATEGAAASGAEPITTSAAEPTTASGAEGTAASGTAW